MRCKQYIASHSKAANTMMSSITDAVPGLESCVEHLKLIAGNMLASLTSRIYHMPRLRVTNVG